MELDDRWHMHMGQMLPQIVEASDIARECIELGVCELACGWHLDVVGKVRSCRMPSRL